MTALELMEEAAASLVPPKDNPHRLALRVAPAGAIRFKRGALVGLTALAATGLATTAWIALRPTSFHLVAAPDDRSPATQSPSDALRGLPQSYGDVPKLGPPLPGDLGRPILDHQRALATTPDGSALPAQSPAMDTAREQRLVQARAARESALLVTSAAKEAPANGAVGAPTAVPAASDPATPALDPDRDSNAQQRKAAFVADTDRDAPVDPHRLVAPPSPYTLSAGSVIAASLITGLRSDLPGLVVAQVTERVFDSVTGRIELIPQGARLIGSYDSVVAFGQRRALVVWQRIVLPDGRSIQLANVPASDAAGYAGLADQVDFHTWTLLKGVALSTLLGVGANLTFSGESDLVKAIRESTQQNVSRAGDQLTSRNLQVQPTITIRPGAAVRLVVHKDLILAPWRG